MARNDVFGLHGPALHGMEHHRHRCQGKLMILLLAYWMLVLELLLLVQLRLLFWGSMWIHHHRDGKAWHDAWSCWSFHIDRKTVTRHRKILRRDTPWNSEFWILDPASTNQNPGILAKAEHKCNRRVVFLAQCGTEIIGTACFRHRPALQGTEHHRHHCQKKLVTPLLS